MRFRVLRFPTDVDGFVAPWGRFRRSEDKRGLCIGSTLHAYMHACIRTYVHTDRDMGYPRRTRRPEPKLTLSKVTLPSSFSSVGVP